MRSRNVPDRNKVFFGGYSDDVTLQEINNARDEALKDLSRKADELGAELGEADVPATATVPSIPGVITGIGTITPVTGLPFSGIIGDRFILEDLQTSAGTGHDCRAAWIAYDKDGLAGFGARTVLFYKDSDIAGTASDQYKFIAHCTDTGISYDLGSPIATTTRLGLHNVRGSSFAYGDGTIATLTATASKTLFLYNQATGWTTTVAATAATGTSFNTVGYTSSNFGFTTSSVAPSGALTRINTSGTHFYVAGDTVVLTNPILDASTLEMLVPAGSYEVTSIISTTAFLIDFNIASWYLDQYGVPFTATTPATGGGQNYIGCFWAGTAGGGYAVYRRDGTLVTALGTGLGNTSMMVGGGYVWLNNGYVSVANPAVSFTLVHSAMSVGLANTNMVTVGDDGYLTQVLTFTSAGITTWGWRRYSPSAAVITVQSTLFSLTGLAAEGEPWGSERTGGTLAATQAKGIVSVRGGYGVVYLAGFLGYQAYQDPLTGLPSLPVTSGPTTWVHDGVNFAILNSAPVDALTLINPGTQNNGSILFSGVGVYSETGIVDDGISVVGGTKLGTNAAQWSTISGAAIG